MTATPSPADGLRECLALLEKATPGQWEVLGDNQGHPAGLEWTIEAPEIANEDDSGWIAGPHGGDGIATTGNPGCREDAEAMAAAVNFLRTHGPALATALRLREGWRPVLTMPKDGGTYLVTNRLGEVCPLLDGVIQNNTGRQDWTWGNPVIAWQPMPAPPTADDLARILEEGE